MGARRCVTHHVSSLRQQGFSKEVPKWLGEVRSHVGSSGRFLLNGTDCPLDPRVSGSTCVRALHRQPAAIVASVIVASAPPLSAGSSADIQFFGAFAFVNDIGDISFNCSVGDPAAAELLKMSLVIRLVSPQIRSHCICCSPTWPVLFVEFRSCRFTDSIHALAPSVELQCMRCNARGRRSSVRGLRTTMVALGSIGPQRHQRGAIVAAPHPVSKRGGRLAAAGRIVSHSAATVCGAVADPSERHHSQTCER